VRRRQNEPRLTGVAGASADMLSIVPQPGGHRHFRTALFQVVEQPPTCRFAVSPGRVRTRARRQTEWAS
jgi:hypothetical protein